MVVNVLWKFMDQVGGCAQTRISGFRDNSAGNLGKVQLRCAGVKQLTRPGRGKYGTVTTSLLRSTLISLPA